MVAKPRFRVAAELASLLMDLIFFETLVEAVQHFKSCGKRELELNQEFGSLLTVRKKTSIIVGCHTPPSDSFKSQPEAKFKK